MPGCRRDGPRGLATRPRRREVATRGGGRRAQAHSTAAGCRRVAHDSWRTDRELAQQTAANRAAVLAARAADESLQRLRSHDHDIPDYGHDAGRDGPSFGR